MGQNHHKPQNAMAYPVGNNIAQETGKIEQHLNEEEQKLKKKKQKQQEDMTNNKLQQLYQKFKEIEALSIKQREIEQNCTKVFSMNRSGGKSQNQKYIKKQAQGQFNQPNLVVGAVGGGSVGLGQSTIRPLDQFSLNNGFSIQSNFTGQKNSQSSNPIEKPTTGGPSPGLGPGAAHLVHHPATNFVTKIGNGARNNFKQASHTTQSAMTTTTAAAPNKLRLNPTAQKTNFTYHQKPQLQYNQPHYAHLQYQV